MLKIVKKVFDILWTGAMGVLFVALVLLVAEVFFPKKDAGNQFNPQTVELFGKSVFRIVNKQHDGGGTGFATLTPSGMPVILTNAHVCEMGKTSGTVEIDLDDNFEKELPGIRFVEVRILSVSTFSDVCVLTSPPYLVPIRLSQENAARHSRITIIGFPLLNELTPSEGVVLRYKTIPIIWDVPMNECVGPTFRILSRMTFFGLQQICLRDLYGADTSAVVYPGNSGSPVLNAMGEVVGILFAGNNVTHHGTILPVTMVNSFIGGM